MPGKLEYFCHQDKDHNKMNKDKYIQKKTLLESKMMSLQKAESTLNQQKNPTVQ